MDRATLQQALARARILCCRCVPRVLTADTRTVERRRLASTVQQVSMPGLPARACAMRVMLGPTRLMKVERLASRVRLVGTLESDRLSALHA